MESSITVQNSRLHRPFCGSAGGYTRSLSLQYRCATNIWCCRQLMSEKQRHSSS